MVFSSLLFLFVYLPAVLAGYYLLPRQWRNLFLFVVNLIFYGWGEPVYVLVMVFSMAFNYGFGILVGKSPAGSRQARLYLAADVALNLLLLGFFKYAGFFAELLRHIPGLQGLTVPDIPLPIGISFYTFQTMSYVIDVYRGDTPYQRSFVLFGTYVDLFPQLIAGPIVRYRDVADQMESRRETPEMFADGIGLFLSGLAKKVLLANQMGLLWDGLRQTMQVNGILGSWVGILAFTLQIYFDFSGYSDMARGLGNMLGFSFLINFDYPYISRSITEFWRRWHISLGTWFKEYVYIPLGGNRKGPARTVLNLLIVWFLTGFWHGASWNFILWGLYYGVLLIIEKRFLLHRLERAPAFLAHLYAMFFIMLGWVIFYFEQLPEMGRFFTCLFTGPGLIGENALVLTLQYLPLLLAAIAACLPLGRRLWLRLAQRRSGPVWQCLGYAAALLLCTAALVASSYNPFLYFRF